jgi:hypothetical protein
MNWALSQLFHLAAFESRMRRNQLKTGALIISLDVDVGSRLLGYQNKDFCNKDIHNWLPESKLGEIEEQAIPLIAQLLDELNIPATFAIRGQLTETSENVIEYLKKCKVKHDIGAHGYSHKCYTMLSESEAEEELIKIHMGLKKHNIEPRSFIFPKNRIAHLSLLEKYRYKSYRGRAGFKYDSLNIEKHGQLYNVHPSFFLGRSPSPFLINRIIDISAKRKLPCHFWFHPSDLGYDKLAIQTRIEKLLIPILNHAKEKEKDGKMSFETMNSVAEIFEEANN